MTKVARSIFVLMLMASVAGAAAQRSATGSTRHKPPPPSFTERLLKFFGISDTPSTLKGPADDLVSGELWIVDLESMRTRAIGSGGGYRSPVFLRRTSQVLALRGSDAIEVPSGAGQAKRLYHIDAIIKLVACGSEDPEEVLILLRGQPGGHPRVGLLNVITGAVTAVPYDATSSQDLRMVESLEGWSRAYGDEYVYVKRQTKQAFSGTIEWTDVFRKVGNAEPVDVSQCDGVNCGQPSLSEDRRLLVFIKSQAQ